MTFGDREGNTPLSGQINVGDVLFFWGTIGGGSRNSVTATSQSRTKSSYLEEAENHLENPTT